MFDKGLVINELNLLVETVDVVLERTSGLHSVDDFLLTNSGMILLDSVCMRLIAIGEGVKKLDKVTGKTLLPRYAKVDWRGVMAMRDIIVHHYFEVDVDVVFETVRKDLPLLKEVLKEMRSDVMFY